MSSATACAPPTAHTSSTPSSAPAAARIVGCGRPPNAACGGDATTSDSTPAACAGTTFITTDDGYTALPPGTYRPDALDRNPALGDGPAGDHLGHGVGAALVGVDLAGPFDRHLEGGADVGIEFGERTVQLGLRDAHGTGADTVELLAVLERGLGTAIADVLDDGADLMQHRVHVHSATGQRAPGAQRWKGYDHEGRCGRA